MGIFSNGKCKSKAELAGKVAVITGANTGIGYETAKDLLTRGARVVMANRNIELSAHAAQKLRDEVPGCQIELVQLNLASLKSVKKCAHEILDKETKIDLLINNAGVMACPYMTTEDGFEMQFQTNHLGHFLFTVLLMPLLKKAAPSRIVNLSSVAHLNGKVKFDDLQSKKSYSPTAAYSQSKLCNVLFTLELVKMLKDTGVAVYAVHPGVVSTELERHMEGFSQWLLKKLNWAKKSPVEGAQTTLHCALDEKLATQHGLYYSDCVSGMTSCRARNKKDATKLWNVSEELVKDFLL